MASQDIVARKKRKRAMARRDGTIAKKPKHQQPSQPEDDSDNTSDADESSDHGHGDGGASLSNVKNDRRSRSAPMSTKNRTQTGKTPESGQSSRESHQRQKQLAQERKASKPMADEMHQAKKLWEKLRRKSHVPKEERRRLVEELFSLATGRMKEFALKHDAVRIVQTAIKYANVERRHMIAQELKGTYSQLAESKYAKFLIGKLLVEGDKEIRDLIVPEFYGKVRKLINHPEASWILDDMYRGAATPEQKAVLLREWYGPEFTIFRSRGSQEEKTGKTAELSQILAAEPNKKGPVLRYLHGMTNQLIQKKMSGFTMLHDAMLQYFVNVQPGSQEAVEYIDMIREDENGDLLKNMAFTMSGARLVSLLLAHGNAKDRKQFLKTYRDTFRLMSSDLYGHLVILTAYDVIDDTVLTSKAIFPELLGKNGEQEAENLVMCVNDPNARLTVGYLLEGASKALFDASHATDLKILKDVWEIRKTTSKKDPDTRRRELIAAISPSLLNAIAAAPLDLTSTAFGCHMVVEILLRATGDKSKALQAVATTASGDPERELDPEESTADVVAGADSQEHISKKPHGGRMLKALIAGGHFDKAARRVIPVDPPLHFADILYPVIKGYIISWATGPSSFVVVNMLETDDFSHRGELMETLRHNMASLAEAAKVEAPGQMVKRAAEEQHKGAGTDRKKTTKRPGDNRVVGNMGSKMLLEKLKT